MNNRRPHKLGGAHPYDHQHINYYVKKLSFSNVQRKIAIIYL
jgi:hypothetical protein